MKRSLLIAATTLLATASYAQYITEAPAGGFDVNKGKDYVVLYAPESVVTQMGDKVIANQNLDQNMEKNQFYYWVCDWSKDQLTLAPVEEEGLKNSWGGDDYLNVTPLWDWGAGNFAAKSIETAYDFSKVTDKHYIHIGLRDGGNAESVYKFQIGPSNFINTNGFQIMVNKAKGESSGDYVGVGSIGHDKKWYSIDIPIADLIDEDGDFGFVYDFSKPFIIPKGTEVKDGDKTKILTEDTPDGAFVMGFDKPTVSEYEYGALEPGETVKPVTIKKLNSAMTVDAVFFYIPENGGTGINDITTANDDSKIEAVYDLSGRRAEMNRPGIYVVKTAKGTKKVAVK